MEKENKPSDTPTIVSTPSESQEIKPEKLLLDYKDGEPRPSFIFDLDVALESAVKDSLRLTMRDPKVRQSWLSYVLGGEYSVMGTVSSVRFYDREGNEDRSIRKSVNIPIGPFDYAEANGDGGAYVERVSQGGEYSGSLGELVAEYMEEGYTPRIVVQLKNISVR